MEKLLLPIDVAQRLGVKLSTIYQWTHQGFIPHIKLGKNVRFDWRKVEEWLEKKSCTGRVKRKVKVNLGQPIH